MMTRRRRQLPGEGDDGGSAPDEAALADHEDEGHEQLALEDGEQGELQGPVGRPTSLGPVAPLFSPASRPSRSSEPGASSVC